MDVTQYLYEVLEAEGISHVFLVPGGLIDPLVMTLGRRLAAGQGPQAVMAAHEGGAAYMAYGYGLASGRFGVCHGIGGPGVCNMVTALAAASADFVPVLAVSGGVPTNQEGRGSFQDGSAGGINDIELVRSLCRLSLEVHHPDLAMHDLQLALRSMLGIPRGVAHLCLPLDVQRSTVEGLYTPMSETTWHPRFLDAPAMDRFWDKLLPGPGFPRVAERVAVLAGRGVEASGAEEALIAFAERFHIPVMTTLGGKGVFPETHPLSLGHFGYAGTRHALETVFSDRIESLIVLGSALNQFDSFYWTRHLKSLRTLVQVDSNPMSMGRSFKPTLAVLGDCREALSHLLEATSDRAEALERSREARVRWVSEIKAGPRCYNEQDCDSDAVPIHPARVIRDLRRAAPADTILVSDGGAHAFFAVHYWKTEAPRQHYLALGLGPMGWALPASIGIQLARAKERTVVVTGDGCMLMHGAEIQTAAQHNVPVIWVVFNNGAHGAVYSRMRRQAPEAAHLTELPVHDWAAYARALGAAAVTVGKPDELSDAFEMALATHSPFVVDVRCSREYAAPAGPWGDAEQDWFAHH